LTAEENAELHRSWVLSCAPDGTDLRFQRMLKSARTARFASVAGR
jgi:hypothetical protein